MKHKFNFLTSHIKENLDILLVSETKLGDSLISALFFKTTGFLRDRFFKTTAQKMKLSIIDVFCICDQIRSYLRVWSNLLKKSLVGNFIFRAVNLTD